MIAQDLHISAGYLIVLWAILEVCCVCEQAGSIDKLL